MLKTAHAKRDGDWSSDGQFIVYTEVSAESGLDLWVFPLAKDAKPRIFLKTKFLEMGPRFSPDGRWVAYVSNEAGVNDVYVRSFPAGDRKWRLSVGGGNNPVWRRDGKELFFGRPVDTIMAVDIRAGASFDAGTPRELFKLSAIIGNFDVTPDGQQFLLSELPPSFTNPPVTVVVNWPALLKR